METQERPAKYLGVDLGGTKLMVGEMTEDGKLLDRWQYPSGTLGQKEALELIIWALDGYFKPSTARERPCAIGVGLVGRVDSRTGAWMEIDSARKEALQVGRILEERYDLPCFLDNDVRSATKAEMLFGWGRNSNDLVYVNIGTGIAAGIVTGGHLITGRHFNSGEVGHTSSGIDFRMPCVCGRDGCVEPVASGLGLDQCARLLAEQYPDTKLAIPEDGKRVMASDIFALYDEDPLCRVLTDNAALGIANLIMNLVRFCDPDTVVLGGGVVSDRFLYPKILANLNQHTIRFVTNGIVLTELDPRQVGILGACSNAMKGMKDAL